MAANQIAPHLLNDFKGDAEFEKVAVLALGVNEETFKGQTERPVIPLKGANLNNPNSIAEAMRTCGMDNVTHVFWFLDANRPPKAKKVVLLRHALNASVAAKDAISGLMNVMPSQITKPVYGLLSYVAGSGTQPRNIQWLTNMFQALEEVNAPVENFCLGTGGKHYGMHQGPALWSGYTTPFEEDQKRCPGPLSYFEMEDFVADKAEQGGFSYNVIRPTFIVGNTKEMTNTSQSFALLIAVYACILKAQNKPLIFPGSEANWFAKQQLSTSKKIAQVACWASTGSAAGLGDGLKDPAPGATKNQAFNVVSCDEFCWAEVWEDLADYFGMEAGGAPEGMLNAGEEVLSVLGGEKTATKAWNQLKKIHGLQDLTFQQVFNADFLDKTFSPGWDAQFSTEKISRLGYPKAQIFEGGEPAAIITRTIDALKADKIIPTKPEEFDLHSKAKVEMDLGPAAIP